MPVMNFYLGVFLLIVLIGIIKLIIDGKIEEKKEKYGIGRQTIQYRDENTGRTLNQGRGDSLGDALADSFEKTMYGVSVDTKEELLKKKLALMNKALAEYRPRMFDVDIAKCEKCIKQMNDVLSRKSEQKRIEEHEKLLRQVEREVELSRIRAEKEKEMTERQRYIFEQRRLMTASLRYEVMRRDNFRCVICGSTAEDGVKLHVDHYIPLAKGGRTEMSNLRTLCESCNLGKGSKIE